MSAAGGKRTGAGAESDFKSKKRSSAYAHAIEAFQDEALKDLHAVYEVVRDLAKGKAKVLAKIEWRDRAKRLLIEDEQEFEGSDGETIWVYLLKPDMQAAKLLVEHGIGKAGTKPVVDSDTTINLICNVPRPGKGEK